jgi:HK97 gp10 family phage protein
MGFDMSEVHRLASDLDRAPIVVNLRNGQTLRRSARQVYNDARRFAPVQTGALKSEIELVYYSDKHAQVISRIRYASYVEYGTSDTAPQPYMRPAADRVINPLADGAGDDGERIL